MPWEKSFNPEDAITNAITVFWDKGYEAASMADLIKAMEINKGSLYNAFGSKKELFKRALAQYDRDRTQIMLENLNAIDAPLDAIVGLFGLAIEHNCSNPDKRGCLLVNTALELRHHDKEIHNTVTMLMDNMRDFFEANIKRGHADGSISTHIDPQSTALVLCSLLIGMQVLSRGAYEPESLASINAQVLRLLAA